MEFNRREALIAAGTVSLAGLSCCLTLKYWEEDEPDQKPEAADKGSESTPSPEISASEEPSRLRGECRRGYAETRFELPRNERVYFSENPEISGSRTLEGVLTGENEGVRIDYLNTVKYLEGNDQECFLYSPGGFSDFDYGEWHARCFEIIHEYEDRYLLETYAVADTPGFDQSFDVPICLYDS